MKTIVRIVLSYLTDLFLKFVLIIIMINRIISWIKTFMFFCFFPKDRSLYFLIIMWMKNVNNFQIAKVQPHDLLLLSICLKISKTWYFRQMLWRDSLSKKKFTWNMIRLVLSGKIVFALDGKWNTVFLK